MSEIDSEIFVEGVILYGSILTLLYNKKISCHFMLESIMSSELFMDLFKECTKSYSDKDAVLNLLKLYPALHNSKNTTMLIKKLHGTSVGNRKKYI